MLESRPYAEVKTKTRYTHEAMEGDYILQDVAHLLLRKYMPHLQQPKYEVYVPSKYYKRYYNKRRL